MEHVFDDTWIRQKQFKIYLSELDRRRGTDYTKIYPQIYNLLKDI